MTITAKKPLTGNNFFIALTKVRDIFVPENEQAVKLGQVCTRGKA